MMEYLVLELIELSIMKDPVEVTFLPLCIDLFLLYFYNNHHQTGQEISSERRKVAMVDVARALEATGEGKIRQSHHMPLKPLSDQSSLSHLAQNQTHLEKDPLRFAI